MLLEYFPKFVKSGKSAHLFEKIAHHLWEPCEQWVIADLHKLGTDV